MRVVVPFTRLRAETVAALEMHAVGHQVEYRDVSKDDEAFWRLWKEIWADGETFAIIEHDIVIHETVLEQFDGCGEPWCTFGYPYEIFKNMSEPYHGTGCTRFRAEVMQAIPDLWDTVAEREGLFHPRRHWCSLDGFSQLELWQAGFHGHRHEPMVGHVDPSISHDCRAGFRT